MGRWISLLVIMVCVMLIPISAMAASATLTWTANSESDLSGYEVFRGNGVCAVGPLQPLIINAVPVVVNKPLSTFTDTTVPTFDGDLCYEINAVDIAGNKSGRSNRATKAVNLIPPTAPAGLTIGTVLP